ncbi:MAG: D-alanyl-D-alanine carboxypeptidase/D-alanyl-D-alanine-endopeptidase [Candidatus Tectomicrobia bacterium RIFCSPLOWO2_12_FULL_69_37]|nr:MAG: D-alanyl-D-alanine carboxypeptidase/D-alanyl-D-alanine-endopeptidase [Candidatus Tectomicrobia bacterium RIFCSPLOWO2_02_FULL_70_19]OGL67626.1 MAG: D-alanyl-D-alanine carboxypeptidase/D-alanyl-D-alanine-endopeptidase [Candidatus Tectomicrobia bacterium RIFCSPLOWO2_12_FULL_69_37]
MIDQPPARFGACAAAALAGLLGLGAPPAAGAPAKAPAQNGPAISSRGDLEAAIRQAVGKWCARPGSLSVAVRSLTAGETLFSHHPRVKRIPASNQKLATTAAALARLGPDYTFPTDVYAGGPVRGGVLEGNLYLKGYGDPFLVQERVRELAHELRLLGVRRVKGDLIADDTYFDSVRYGPGWHAEGSLRPYQAPHGALSFNFNVVWLLIDPGKEGGPARVQLEVPAPTIRVEGSVATGPPGGRPQVRLARRRVEGRDRIRVGGTIPANSRRLSYPVTISEPALYAAGAFALFLKEAGVALGGEVRRGATPKEAELLARTLSRPLGELVRDVNKVSSNFMAEQILKTLGAEELGLPGTAEKGLRVVHDFLAAVGVPADAFELADGSGLSRGNRFTAEGLVALLEGVHRDFRLRPEFEASLAVVGIDGTVRRKMQRTSSVRRARVKSGLLDRVQTLSGYAVADNGEVVAFAILSNENACNPNPLFHEIILPVTLLDRPLPPALALQSEAARRNLALPMPNPRQRDRWRAQGRARTGPVSPEAGEPAAAEAVVEGPPEPAATGLEMLEEKSAPGGERGAKP